MKDKSLAVSVGIAAGIPGNGKRFADSNGWGYRAFEYNAASDGFRPATVADQPPQANDAKCGAARHTAARNQDYVFTAYPKR